MIDRIWDFFVDTMMTLFMPLVCTYFGFCSNTFINTSVQNASGLEWVGNTMLSPVQYLLAGKEAIQLPDGSWELKQRFDYNHGFWIKATSSVLALPTSLVLGTAVKGLGMLNSESATRYNSLLDDIQSARSRPHFELYHQLGIEMGDAKEKLIAQGYKRRPGDEMTLFFEKEALKDISAILTNAQIPWWVDCGTCLGAYRYSGVIPWDGDIDIAVLAPDFANVQHALNQLDPKKYIVQDWSSRERPDSYMKVYVRKTGTLIDIYHFDIDLEKRQIAYILALESNLFFPEWWKVRERRFKVPVAFETVFPLKKAQFDGIEVFVPNNVEKYLQRYYGENLDPAKIYDPIADRYEKDLSHPYWQRVYAH